VPLPRIERTFGRRAAIYAVDPLQTLSIDGPMIGMADKKETAVYDAVSGGADLMRWFGHVPTFHAAEILSAITDFEILS